ncbi:mechanosensitive ion channel family protein [Bizionia sediminis]|uniref:Mechanosensitive ion channel family protein n=1 Tax=Bizionia sediminis TaxID=1737064 RepID=A0ABW5KU70_9FLAO
MLEFLQTHQKDIIHGLIIITGVIILRWITNTLHKWLSKEKQLKSPTRPSRPLRVLKNILNTLWIVLGLIALSYIIADESQHNSLSEDFKTAVYVAVVLALTIIAATTANMWFLYDIEKKTESGYDATSYKFLRYVALAAIYFFGGVLCLLAFPSLKTIAQTALGGAGVLTIITGLSAQEALANIIGGLFIILFKPFKINDLVKISDSMIGRVTDITLRHTIIRNFENKMIIIPNAIINKEKLINYDMGELKISERIEIGISYDSDVELAKKIMREECENHPLILDNRTQTEIHQGKPIVKTALIELNDYSVTIRAWTWARNYNDAFQLKIDVLDSIKKRFEKEGIEIPFPYRTVIMKKETSH